MKVHGAFWHHDGAAEGARQIGYGTWWVVVGLIVELPFLVVRGAHRVR